MLPAQSVCSDAAQIPQIPRKTLHKQLLYILNGLFRPGQRALHKSVATKPEGTTAVIWFEPSPALYPEALTNAALVLHLVRHVYLGPEELPRYPHYGCVKGVQLRWAAWKGVLLR